MDMRKTALAFALALVLPLAASSQTPAPSLPLGQGRPETAGVTRTTLKDDAKSTVTRVHFKPGATEPPHTHPVDVIIVPVIGANVTITIGSQKLTAVKAGDVQFIPREVTHGVANTGSQDFELIAIALK
jgi:quercetin dioxygenase-like cupin family protein